MLFRGFGAISASNSAPAQKSALDPGGFGLRDALGAELQDFELIGNTVLASLGLKTRISKVEALMDGLLSKGSKFSQILSPNGHLGGPFPASVKKNMFFGLGILMTMEL